MPRNKKNKRNNLPYATDLSEHCRTHSSCYENQFTKFSRKKAEEKIIELNKGKPKPLPLIEVSREVIKAHNVSLRIEDGVKRNENLNVTLTEVLSLIDTWILEKKYNDNFFGFHNPYLGGIELKILGLDSWEIYLVINKNKEFFTVINLDGVSSDMVKILTINFFNGDFVGKKYTVKVRDDAEIRELQTKFKKLQEELQKGKLNCSFCFSFIKDLTEIKCQYCGNELDVFRKVQEIFK